MSEKLITTADGKVTGRLRIVKGHHMTEQGFIDDRRPRKMEVIVTPDGKAYPIYYADPSYDPDTEGPTESLAAERWGDADYLGRNFSPDHGEFERCGIVFELRGFQKTAVAF